MALYNIIPRMIQGARMNGCHISGRNTYVMWPGEHQKNFGVLHRVRLFIIIVVIISTVFIITAASSALGCIANISTTFSPSSLTVSLLHVMSVLYPPRLALISASATC